MAAFQAALVSNFDAKALEGQVEEVIRAVGLEMLERIRRRTAVDTGTAQRGWEISFSGSGKDTEFEISNDVEYVVFLENGTYKMAAQPMIRPTLEEAQDIIDGAINSL